MPSSIKVHTIHRTLLISIVGFILIFLITGINFISAMFVDEAHHTLEKHTRSWAKLIADKSISAIETNDHDKLHTSLKDLKVMEFINYVHIYRFTDSEKQLEFFTSYNKNANYPAIPDKSNQIIELSTPRYTQHYLELIAPIMQGNNQYGYVYIQASNEHIEEFTRKTNIISLIMITMTLLLTLLIMVRLQRQITQPIKNVIRTIQHISQSKDYSTRCQSVPYKELDILGKNINIMLSRIEKHFQKLNNAEQETLRINQELKDKVTLRTDALKESNQELLSTLEKLHQFQNQLVESEKMASLGDMVAGVAHEVNTPIGLGVTASTLLVDRIGEIKTLFENKTLKSSQLKRFLNEGEENVEIIYRNLKRAADLISSFKKLAVDQSSEENRHFNVKQLVNEVFLTLAPQLKKQPVTFNLHCPDDLFITSKPGPINQILINLLLNSLLHAFDGRENGEITINIMSLSDQLNINYQDNGNGVDHTIKSKIFDPFITTKRGSGGSGLGLHLVYNLVTQALGGHIHFESEPEQGVTFDINFPVTIINR